MYVDKGPFQDLASKRICFSDASAQEAIDRYQYYYQGLSPEETGILTVITEGEIVTYWYACEYRMSADEIIVQLHKIFPWQTFVLVS